MPRLLWLPDILRDAGLKVVPVPGWEKRGASNIDPQVLLEHHTASSPKSRHLDAPSLSVIAYHGNGVTPAPLSNILQSRRNIIYVVASGVTNNAGRGSWLGRSGNKITIGWETEQVGIPSIEPWSPSQYDTWVVASGAICRYMGWGPERCVAHKEWSPGRKTDPSFAMNPFRRRVADWLEGRNMTPEQEADLLDKVNKLYNMFEFDGAVHEHGWVIQSQVPVIINKLDLILAALNKGTDPQAIARAVVAELGVDLAQDLLKHLSLAIDELRKSGAAASQE